MKRFVAVFSIAFALFGWTPSVQEKDALSRISADSLRGHLSFLASDALEGRGTPSRGLDLAAEYIAAQFRRAGLEPAAPNGSYFQTAPFVQWKQNTKDLRISVSAGDKTFSFTSATAMPTVWEGIDLNATPMTRLPASDIAGKVVVQDFQDFRPKGLKALGERKPALIVLLARKSSPSPAALKGGTRLLAQDEPTTPGLVILYGEGASKLLESKSSSTITAHISAPDRTPLVLRNVAGILRGSDPALRDQFLVLSAHYDHLGMKAEGTGDRIYNGANDNGSGTVSVIEIASALASMPVHPKRSILFLTFFGEEEGLLGAFYYTKHPLVPLAKTVANLNLEQMGRTDEQDGKEVSAFSLTGPTYSDVPKILEDAAKSQGVHMYRKKDADSFFDRSDNYAFAEVGIVDHTLVVAYEYPDYHGLGDKWQKIDYDNMAKVDRGVAAGLLCLSDNPQAPKWSNASAVEQYRKAVSATGQ